MPLFVHVGDAGAVTEERKLCSSLCGVTIYGATIRHGVGVAVAVAGYDGSARRADLSAVMIVLCLL